MAMRTTKATLTAAFFGIALSAHAQQRPIPAAAQTTVRRVDTTRLRALPNARGTALALNALVRFANGAAPTSSFERQIEARLGGIPNAKGIAKRLVGPIEQLPVDARRRALPNVADVGTLGALPTDPKAVVTAGGGSASAGSTSADDVLGVWPGDELPPQTPSQLGAYEIRYAGVKSNRAASPSGADTLAVFTAFMTTAGEQTATAIKVVPSSAVSLATGASSAAGSGALFAGASLGTTGGALLLDAVMLDDGSPQSLDTARQELELLLALSETFATTLAAPPAARLSALKTAIEYHVGVLHLSNPTKWSTAPVSTRLISGADYASWFQAAPTTTSGIPHKFSLDVAPSTGSYSVFFSTPTYQSDLAKVTVSIQKITSTGSVHDTENGRADLKVSVNVGGAEASRTWQNNNAVTSTWKVFRKMVTSRKVPIVIRVDELDAPPTKKVVSTIPRTSTCYSFCGASATQMPGCPVYLGPCGPEQTPVDVSPKESHVLTLDYDMATGVISGDVTGAKGAAITAAGTNAQRRAALVFKVE